MSRCDATLVAAARDARDLAAFAELVRRYQHATFAVAMSVVGDRALAEDAAQETFLRAWASLDRLRDPTRVAPWLCGIARNVARTLRRDRAREVADDPAVVDELEAETNPLRELMEREADQALSELLRRVPNRYRAPMVLHYAAEQSVSEIAQCLELSETNVKKLLSRGREMLRERAQRFTELTSACRVPATLAIGVIAAVGARSAAAQTTAAAGAVSTLVSSGVALKKILLIVAAVVACLASYVGFRLLHDTDRDAASASTPGSVAQPAPTHVEAAKPPPERSHRLSGVVIDDRTASPLPGATVLIKRAAGGSLATTLVEQQGPPTIVVTDAAGRFAVELSAGHFYVDANLAGYTSRKPPAVEIRTEDIERLEVRMIRGGVRVHGTVADIKGGPVAAAIVTAEAAPGEIPTGRTKAAITGDDGRYELWLAVGEYDLRAEHLAYAPATAHMTVAGPELQRDLDLVPASFIEGVVLDRRSARPVAGAIVFVDGQSELGTLTDEEGRFRLEQLVAGSFALRARAAHQVTLVPNLVELDIGQTRMGVELWLDRGANVSGRVVGEDGRPLAGATAGLLDVTTEGVYAAQLPTDSDGRFVVVGVAPGSYGALAQVFERPVLARRNGVEVGDHDVSDVELVVKNAHVVTGRVVPARLATIKLARPGADLASMAFGSDMSDFLNLETSTARTNADGSFEIPSAPGGAYTLVAIADDGTRGEASVVVGQDTPVTIALGEGSTVRGTIVDRHGKPVAGVGLEATSERYFPDHQHEAITDASGRFVMRGLSRGTHSLAIVDRRCLRQLVVDGSPGESTTTITTDKPADIRLVVTGCEHAVRGIVVDKQGAGVAEAWVQIENDDFRPAAMLTDAAGRFSATGLHDGPFVVTAYHPVHGRGRLESAAPETNHRIELSGGSSLKVVVRQSGQPAVGFELRVRGVVQRSVRSRNADGSITVDSLAAGRYTIEVLADGGTGAAEVVLDANANRTVELELREWILVRGTLVGVDDRPLAGHVVVPLHAVPDVKPPTLTPEQLLTMTSATTDRDGRFELRRVHPDSNVLLVLSPSGEYSGVRLQARPGESRDLGRVAVKFVRAE